MNQYVKWFCDLAHQDRTKLNMAGKKVRAHEGAVTTNPNHDPDEEEVYQVGTDAVSGNSIFPTGKIILHLRDVDILQGLLARHDLKLIYQNKHNPSCVHVAPNCWMDFGSVFLQLEADEDVIMCEKHGLVKTPRPDKADS